MVLLLRASCASLRPQFGTISALFSTLVLSSLSWMIYHLYLRTTLGRCHDRKLQRFQKVAFVTGGYTCHNAQAGNVRGKKRERQRVRTRHRQRACCVHRRAQRQRASNAAPGVRATFGEFRPPLSCVPYSAVPSFVLTPTTSGASHRRLSATRGRCRGSAASRGRRDEQTWPPRRTNVAPTRVSRSSLSHCSSARRLQPCIARRPTAPPPAPPAEAEQPRQTRAV